ncbi:hypothetical protein [Bacillus sp. MUM 13]|uniref:hypothetical protein n=1 Tax=Bacillus sp. MUM 13 TaxID=1678001 RepID=UPI0008F5B1F0|nr:hypothetical protein [Bacillus sp. MUM 13]OIK09392.1 hypothetical protein BIV59_17100 [Bacillus sp. MUM 13]
MNFDTKHLVRWGIPEWLMDMVLLPYVSNASDLLAIGAVLTVLGVPLGYLLIAYYNTAQSVEEGFPL